MKRKRKIWAVMLSLMMVMALSPISTFATASGTDGAAPASVEAQADAQEADVQEPAAEPEVVQPAAEEPAAVEEEVTVEEPAVEEPAGDADGGIVAGALYKDANQGDRQPGMSGGNDGNNYNANYRFGYDSFNSGSSTDLAGLASVSVGNTALSRNSAASTVGAAVSQGVTVSFNPGYYLYQYKIVCGDKYSCQTAARGQATAATGVMSGATNASYTIACTKGDFNHTSKKDPYWILLQLKQDTATYTVTYDWGELKTALKATVPEDNTKYLVNQIVTVKEPSEAAVAEAKSLGYEFTGWELDKSVYQANDKFGMPQKNVTLVAQWEKIEIETVDINVNKIWVDPEGTEHPNVTINLLKNGEKIDSKVLVNGETKVTFSGLDKNHEYSVTEDEVEGYTATIVNPTKENGYTCNITNTINQVYIPISGSKTWIAPEGTEYPKITINLLKNGKEVAEVVLKNGETAYKFEDLEKYSYTYNEDGSVKAVTINNYSVTEDAVEGYTSTIDGYNITNTIDQVYIPISGSKTWIAPEGTEYPKITINLLKNDEEIAEVVLKNGETEYAFGEFPRYEFNKDGSVTLNEYTITEDSVDGYIAKVDGFNVTNTLIEVPVTPDQGDEDNEPDDGTTTDKAADNSDSSAKTGDFMNLGMLIAIMMLAVSGIAGALRFRRRA
ncbi:MAG: Cna B-type domain-containing protein [Firmicutes bacterium]|nr:Cna B-type domain-containing protein [Bacillota bacterium]MDY2920097.1 Cna B-type domain-containing protein [Lentihominibacter sp.]